MHLLVSISRNIYSLDDRSMNKAVDRWRTLIQPEKALGKLEDVTVMLSGVYGNANIEDNPKKCVLVFAGDHGVFDEKISLRSQELTRKNFENLSNTKSAVGSFAKVNGVDIICVDMGLKGTDKIENVLNYKVREGTDNILTGPAMSMDEAVKAIENGIEVAEQCIVDGYQIIGVGDIGASNTTPATTILAVMSGKDPIEITDHWDRNSEENLRHKSEIIRKSVEINNPNPTDGIEVLSKVGGFEIGGIVGVILGCAANRIPVVIDGFVSYAAALIAYRINPKSIDYLITSQKADELGTEVALDILKLDPMLTLNMRVGEGTGAVLAMKLIDSAIYAYNHMSAIEQ